MSSAAKLSSALSANGTSVQKRSSPATPAGGGAAAAGSPSPPRPRRRHKWRNRLLKVLDKANIIVTAAVAVTILRARSTHSLYTGAGGVAAMLTGTLAHGSLSSLHRADHSPSSSYSERAQEVPQAGATRRSSGAWDDVRDAFDAQHLDGLLGDVLRARTTLSLVIADPRHTRGDRERQCLCGDLLVSDRAGPSQQEAGRRWRLSRRAHRCTRSCCMARYGRCAAALSRRTVPRRSCVVPPSHIRRNRRVSQIGHQHSRWRPPRRADQGR